MESVELSQSVNQLVACQTKVRDTYRMTILSCADVMQSKQPTNDCLHTNTVKTSSDCAWLQ